MRKHIPALDGIRGIAILMVIGLHCRELLPVNSSGIQLFALGWSGVDLFFALSGFLITGILLDTRDSPSYFRTFYKRRIVRIFPLYFAYLIPALLLTHEPHPWWFVAYLSNWRSIDSDFLSHLWSLAVEEQFYLLWPAIVWLLPRRTLAWTCAGMVPLAIAFRAFAPLAGLSAYTATPCRMDTLALGALVAIAARDFPQMARRLLAPVVAVSFVGAEATIRMAGNDDFWASLPTKTVGESLIGVIFACLVFYGATSNAGALHGLLITRPLRVCGKYSYAMYVLHQLVLYPSGRAVSRYFGLPSGAGFLLYFLLAASTTLGLAWISWRLIEQPFLRLKERFTYAGQQERLRRIAA